MSGAPPSRRVLELARSARAAGREALLCVVGPTASGKTALAIEVAEALDGEIVSADSVQIYRGFDIGAGKPTREELERVPHHLVGAIDPLDPIDAASWAKLADAAIADIRSRGKVPVVCGGTYFWVRALVLGLVNVPAANDDVRARHRALVEERGRPALHAELARIDPAAATRLHPNDVVRVSRALEVYELSGRAMSDWQAAHAFKERRYDVTTVGLSWTPEALTARIEARVAAMLDAGWIDETRGLLEAGYGEARAMGAVGYAEVHAHLDGRLAREALAPTIVTSTRVFARRQRTWLNHVEVEWLTP